MSQFKRVLPEVLTGDFVKKIHGEWALLTAAKPDGSYNTMTVSWGGVGVLWNTTVCFVFVRPQRYTHEFTEAGDKMTLTFFPKEYKDALKYCGKMSGRDVNKAKECGLTPVSENGFHFFAEAKEVLALRKLCVTELTEDTILEPAISPVFYEKKDYHTMYICEIVAAAKTV